MGNKLTKHKSKKGKKAAQAEAEEYAAHQKLLSKVANNPSNTKYSHGSLRRGKGFAGSVPNLPSSCGQFSTAQAHDYEELGGTDRAVPGQGVRNKNQQKNQGTQKMNVSDFNRYRDAAANARPPARLRADLGMVKEETIEDALPRHLPARTSFGYEPFVLNQPEAVNINGRVFVPAPNQNSPVHPMQSPVPPRVHNHYMNDATENCYSSLRRPGIKQREPLPQREDDSMGYARPADGSFYTNASVTQALDCSVDTPFSAATALSPAATARGFQELEERAINNQIKVYADTQRNFDQLHSVRATYAGTAEGYPGPPQPLPAHGRHDGGEASTAIPAAESLSYETGVTRNSMIKLKVKPNQILTVYFNAETVGDFCEIMKSKHGYDCCIVEKSETDQSVITDEIKLTHLTAPFVVYVNDISNVILSVDH